MKSTGMIRKIDELGRVVIPIEIRTQFNLSEKDSVEIYVDDNSIILKKYEKSCIFCENTSNLLEYKGKPICNKCFKEIKSLKKIKL